MGYYNQMVSSKNLIDTPLCTTLEYDLPHHAMVQLEVISGLGKIAFVVLDELQPKGDYILKNQATRLKSGTYLLRTKITTKQETVQHIKRIVLTKNTTLQIEKKVNQYYKITIVN